MSIDLSLVRISRIFSLLPAYKRPTIHIAGTNGKGSVTAILSSIFASSRVSVGCFNSPHLLHVWDSISLNGLPVSKDTYRSVRNNVETINKTESIGASNFEILTATAAQIFEQARVDVAIFEVGLGGRLDATNVLPDDVILASAITSVDLDHQQFLGNTPAAIAREKAGIARKSKPCVLGAQTHAEVHLAVQEVVDGVGGNLVRAIEVTPRPRDTSSCTSLEGCQFVTAPFHPWNTTLELEFPLRGSHQLQNLATALTVLSTVIDSSVATSTGTVLHRISPSTLHDGVLKVRWPGRLERIRLSDPPMTVLVDGAHNAASAAALQSYLLSNSAVDGQESSRRARTFILGLSHSPPKKPIEVLAPLLRPGDCVAFVPFSDVEEMPWVKNVSLYELEVVGKSLVKGGTVKLFEPVPDDPPLSQLKRALQWAATMNLGRDVVLAGSLYLVADFYRLRHEAGKGGND